MAQRLVEAIKEVDLDELREVIEEILDFVRDSSNYEWIKGNPE